MKEERLRRELTREYVRLEEAVKLHEQHRDQNLGSTLCREEYSTEMCHQ